MKHNLNINLDKNVTCFKIIDYIMNQSHQNTEIKKNKQRILVLDKSMQSNQRPIITLMVYRSFNKDLMKNYELEFVCFRKIKK